MSALEERSENGRMFLLHGPEEHGAHAVAPASGAVMPIGHRSHTSALQPSAETVASGHAAPVRPSQKPGRHRVHAAAPPVHTIY